MSTESKNSMTVLSKVAGSLLVLALSALFSGAISNRATNTQQDTRLAALEDRISTLTTKQDRDHDELARLREEGRIRGAEMEGIHRDRGQLYELMGAVRAELKNLGQVVAVIAAKMEMTEKAK